MRSFFIYFLAIVFLASGCQSSKESVPTPETAGIEGAPEQLEQLRQIASADEEEEQGEDEQESYNAMADAASNNEIFRADRGGYWEHDMGPDVRTPVGRGYAELFAKTPNYRAIGQLMLSTGSRDRGDKFRWQFGPMFYRGRLGANQVKVLIIGQEGAQDENVSDRSFTGGTGGRMQNMLASMGIDHSYLFVNTFVYTIQGQYADFAPMLVDGKVRWRNLLTPGMLQMAQDPRSPIVAHRHALWDHVIQSNRDSLQLIIAVGGAAQDSLATYIMSKGGNCLSEISEPNRIQTLLYGSASAGGNKRFFFPVDRQGNNLLVRRGEQVDYKNVNVQNRLKERVNSPEVQRALVASKEGPLKNGLMDLRQTTMRLETCQVGRRNSTLFGLPGIARDIRFIGVQHPGSNSPTLQSKFAGALSTIHSWQKSNWRLMPDQDVNGKTLSQPFERGFVYRHKPVPRRDFRFGLPDVIGLGDTNTTRREGGTAIEIGSRAAGQYSRIQDAYAPAADYQGMDVPNEPPKTNFNAFDFGPGDKWSRIFTERIPAANLLRTNRTAAAKFGAWAIYRGRPEQSEVIVLADQTSHDDVWVGRALMGFEGQRLQGFLTGIGAGLNYTILRTLPMDTLGGDVGNIKQLLDLSREWRNGVLARLLQENQGRVKMILTLGPQAENEIRQFRSNVPVISLTGPNGYKSGFQEIQKLQTWNTGGRRMAFNIMPMPIAREDVPYGMRKWTGTAGDRVLRSEGRMSGQLYLINAPQWATRGQAAYPKRLGNGELNYLNNLLRFAR